MQKAISINPEFAEAYDNMGSAYAKKGNYDKAIYVNIGKDKSIAYTKKGNYDKAIELFEKAISINPEYADAYFNMGVSYGQQGNYDKAISCLKKAAILGSKEAQKYLTAKRINW